MARLRGRPGAVYLEGHNVDDGEAVTPNDSTPLQEAGVKRVYRFLWVGVAGDVSLLMSDGSIVVWPAVPAGGWVPITNDGFTRVRSTGTTATNIIVGWSYA